MKASHTASRAKSAALTAAQKAKESYESCNSSTSEEVVQSAQAHASNTQSHAIHAAVVEYEAKIAKQRAAVALAHDIRCWNVHRKKSLLGACVGMAQLHKDSCRHAADAWENLRDGFIESSCWSYQEREHDVTSPANHVDVPEYTTTILNPIGAPDEEDAGKVFFNPVENHFAFRTTGDASAIDEDGTIDRLSVGEDDSIFDSRQWEVEKNVNTQYFSEKESSSTILQASTLSIPPVFDDVDDSFNLAEEHNNPDSELGDSFTDVYHLSNPEISLRDNHFSFQQNTITDSNNYFGRIKNEGVQATVDCGGNTDSSDDDSSDDDSSEGNLEAEKCDDQSNEDDMTTSMQSLIDGLISWGGEDEQGSELEEIGR